MEIQVTKIVYNIKRLSDYECSNCTVLCNAKLLQFMWVEGDCVLHIEVLNSQDDKALELLFVVTLRNINKTVDSHLYMKANHTVDIVLIYGSRHQPTKDFEVITTRNGKSIFNDPTAGTDIYALDKKDERKIVLVSELEISVFGKSQFTIGSSVYGSKSTHVGESNTNMFHSTTEPVSKDLDDINVYKKDPGETVLSQGTARFPKLQQMVKKYFNDKTPSREISQMKPLIGVVLFRKVSSLVYEIPEAIVLLNAGILTADLGTDRCVMTKLILRNIVVSIKKSRGILGFYCKSARSHHRGRQLGLQGIPNASSGPSRGHGT